MTIQRPLAMTMQRPPDVLVFREAASFLRVSERTLATLMKNKVVPGFQIGKQWRFSRAVLEDYVRQQSGGQSNG